MNRLFISIIYALALANCTGRIKHVTVESKNGQIETYVTVNSRDNLTYSINQGDNALVLESPLGLTLDSINIGNGVRILGVQQASKDESYAWVGNQDTIINLYNESRIEILHTTSKQKYYLEVRNFNNGIAFRYVIPSEGTTTISKEQTTFTLPNTTKVGYASGPFSYGWLQRYQERDVADIDGELLAPPATFKLPGDKGYLAITEAGLYNFHGAVLFGGSEDNVHIGFVDNEGNIKTGAKFGVPKKKYRQSVVKDISWKQDGDIITPWRVVMFGENLDELVNNNIPALVNPEPDKDLFPEGVNSKWIKPGKSLWTWLSERHRDQRTSPDLYMKYIDYAADFNLEYVTIDEGWYKWESEDKSNWDIVSDIVEAGKANGVGIWLWKSSSPRRGIDGFDNVQFRKEFMQKCKEVGVAGIKVDFFQTENKFTVDLMEDILIDAAKNELLVVFHGVNKPTGECRTYPNLLVKEAVRGLECVGAENTWAPGPPWPYHNTIIPFTRLLAGPADYTPLHFGRWKAESTTMAHQIASAYMFSSPLTFFAADPEDIEESEAKNIIVNMPVYWDETRVLSESKIGEIAAFVRRKGNVAYLIILNGEKEKYLDLSLDFLLQNQYDVEIVKDIADSKQIKVVKTTISKDMRNRIKLLSGGGYLMKIEGINSIRLE